MNRYSLYIPELNLRDPKGEEIDRRLRGPDEPLPTRMLLNVWT
jgi:hypothetical protein